MRPSTIRQALRAMRGSLNNLRASSPHILTHCTKPTLSIPHWQMRWLSTPAPFINETRLSAERYHELSNATMDSMLESLESLLDNYGNTSYEVEYQSGVLTLELGEHGTYVINKQPPNKQIWLSSPLSGPKRYDYSEDHDTWIYARDGQMLGDLLNEELTNALGREIDLQLSTKV